MAFPFAACGFSVVNLTEAAFDITCTLKLMVMQASFQMHSQYQALCAFTMLIILPPTVATYTHCCCCLTCTGLMATACCALLSLPTAFGVVAKLLNQHDMAFGS